MGTGREGGENWKRRGWGLGEKGGIRVSGMLLYHLLMYIVQFTVLDMPKRPPWKYSMSKEQVERSEQEMFENFLDKIYYEYKLSELSYFERNLEVNVVVVFLISPLF